MFYSRIFYSRMNRHTVGRQTKCEQKSSLELLDNNQQLKNCWKRLNKLIYNISNHRWKRWMKIFTELPFGNERILYHTYMVKPSCKLGTCDRVVIWKLNENFVRLIDKVYEFLIRICTCLSALILKTHCNWVMLYK